VWGPGKISRIRKKGKRGPGGGGGLGKRLDRGLANGITGSLRHGAGHWGAKSLPGEKP